jgi:hypothetical protein
MTLERVSPGKLSNMFFSAKVLTNFTHQKLFLSLARQVDIFFLGHCKNVRIEQSKIRIRPLEKLGAPAKREFDN